jgi:hypothetical protein
MGKDMRVGICAIIRDEASYVEEWVRFHRAQGVKEFRIYDNGSIDGTPEALRALGIEPVIWAGRPHDFDAQQRAAYVEAALMLAGHVDWLAFIDIDEFIFGRTEPLAKALAAFPAEAGAIAVQQLMFGSGGQTMRLPGPVTRRFVRCAPRKHPENRWFKTIARPELVLDFETVHSVRLHSGAYVMADGSPLDRQGPHPGEASRRVEGRIGLHHYALKSLEEFRIKQAKWLDRSAAGRMSDGYFFGRDAYANLEECRDLMDIEQRYADAPAPKPAVIGKDAPLARPVWGINHVVAYGQSYATGWGGWPPLSTEPRHDNLMLGQSVRAATEMVPGWTPLGRVELRPMVATAQDADSGRPLAAGERPAGPADATPGETVLEGALAFWRARMLAEAGNPGRLLGSACGTAGRTLEQLSKGADPELFNRLRDCVRLARHASAAEGLSYGLCALLLLQGEANVSGFGVRDRDSYKRLLQRLLDDVMEDVVADVAGQDRPPAVLLYQTGGAYADDELGVAQAQLEVALEQPGVFLASPSYPYPESGGHLDANGYRWLGAQFGKVLHLVLTRGATWRPLHPLRAAWDGASVRVSFHVPHPPLAWGRPFVGLRRQDVPDRGFTLLDSAGAVPLAAVELDGAEAVRLRPARPPQPGPLLLRYAARTRHAGRGALHDSDPTMADDVFVADFPGAAYASSDAAELAGRRYPLVNWCAAFTMPVAREEKFTLPPYLAPMFPL